MNNLSGFLVALEAAAEAEAAKIVDAAENFVKEVVNDLEIALEALAPIAINAVLSAASKAVSGEEKFGQAVVDAIQVVEAQGKTIGLQTAQMAIQQAYLLVQNVASK